LKKKKKKNTMRVHRCEEARHARECALGRVKRRKVRECAPDRAKKGSLSVSRAAINLLKEKEWDP